jgi:hypothetical protein
MPCYSALQSWITQVVAAFSCSLSLPQAKTLALYSFGAMVVGRCGLNSVATVLAPILGVCFATIRSRLQEFYQSADVKSGDRRRQLDVEACFAPLLAWVLKDWPSKRLALALDATSLNDRFTVLSISVVYRGSAIPVAWKVLPANVRHPWKPEWIALLQAFQAQIPSDWTVIVMTDRGLYARWLFQAIVALGWHPLMRINQESTFRAKGSRLINLVTKFAPEVGRRGEVRGDAFPKTPRCRLRCTLLACWEPGHDQAWFVVTDLRPEQAECLWYGMRTWIERGFKLLKSGGWQWQLTRITDPERAARMWLVLAVSTLYIVSLGGEADAADIAVETVPEVLPPRPRPAASPKVAATVDGPAPARRPEGPVDGLKSRKPRIRSTGTKNRLVSVFRQGMAAFLILLTIGHPLPKPQWKPEAWIEFRVETKIDTEQLPSPIPRNPPL